MPAHRSYYLWIIGTIVPFVLSSCSRFDSTSNRYIKLTNKSNQTLAFTAWEVNASEQSNISQRFASTKSVNPLIQPGQSVKISVKNVNGHFGPGKTMKVFLYTIGDDTAFFNTDMMVSYKNLSLKNFKIVIRNDDLHFQGAPLYYHVPINK